MLPSLFIKLANALCQGCIQTAYFIVYSSTSIPQAAIQRKDTKAERPIVLTQFSIQYFKIWPQGMIFCTLINNRGKCKMQLLETSFFLSEKKVKN